MFTQILQLELKGSNLLLTIVVLVKVLMEFIFREKSTNGMMLGLIFQEDGIQLLLMFFLQSEILIGTVLQALLMEKWCMLL